MISKLALIINEYEKYGVSSIRQELRLKVPLVSIVY